MVQSVELSQIKLSQINIPQVLEDFHSIQVLLTFPFICPAHNSTTFLRDSNAQRFTHSYSSYSNIYFSDVFSYRRIVLGISSAAINVVQRLISFRNCHLTLHDRNIVI